MAHARQVFALVGYSEELEMKPLKFVDPIPASRICSACSNIPRSTYTLLCGHTFCEPCYESCGTTSECVCPLDGDVCVPADVTTKEYPAENVLRRKVYCWNKDYGCGVVLPASQIAEHVRHGCQHHVTRCPTCLATVLSRDVCTHLKSGCRALVLHAAPQPQEGVHNEKTLLVEFEEKVEQRVRELDDKLAQLSLHCGSLNDKLVGEVCHNTNTLKEALTEEIGKVSAQTRDRLVHAETDIKESLLTLERRLEERVGELDAKHAQLSSKSDVLSDKLVQLCHSISHLKEAISEEIGAALGRNADKINIVYAEKSESLKTSQTPLLAAVPSDAKTHQRVMTGYAALKEKAMKDGWSRSISDKVYLRGYLITWGIDFGKQGDSVYLNWCFQLHQGRQDDILDWPFTKQFQLSIIHPETRHERLLRGTGSSAEGKEKYFSRPIEGSNTPGYIPSSSVKSSDIERDGYVEKDQLLLRFEVLG